MVVTMSQNSWDVLENLLITDIFLLVFDNHGQKQLSAQWDEIASPLKVLKLVFTEVSDGRSCSKNWFAAVLLDSPQLAFFLIFFFGLVWREKCWWENELFVFAGLNSGCLQLQTWFQIIPEWNKRCHLALSSFSFALRHWSPSLSFFFSLIFECYKVDLKFFNQFTVFTAIQAWQTVFIHALMVSSYLFDNEWKAPFFFCLWQ